MARPTKSELDPKLDQRQRQLAQMQDIVRYLENKLGALQQQARLRKQQDSVSKGLYDETDKLTKKAPGEHVSELALLQINDLIEQVKGLITGDRYIDQIKIFVPAGDMPQLRDVLSVLRQIRQGLERFAEDNQEAIRKTQCKLDEAKAVKLAVNLYMQGSRGDNVVAAVRRELGANSLTPRWLTGVIHPEFDFLYLDTLDLNEYFALDLG